MQRCHHSSCGQRRSDCDSDTVCGERGRLSLSLWVVGVSEVAQCRCAVCGVRCVICHMG